LAEKLSPFIPEEGEIAETDGGGYFTVKASVRIADWSSGLVTRTLQIPGLAPFRSIVQLIRPGVSTVTRYATISVSPARKSETAAPFWNPVPERFGITTGPEFNPVVGVKPVRVGAG
jgi:hypothetical protein